VVATVNGWAVSSEPRCPANMRANLSRRHCSGGHENRMAVPTGLGENVCRVALTENRLIPQSRIRQAKLLLQLFNDAGKSLVDGPSVG
jgi:hypothetical protein